PRHSCVAPSGLPPAVQTCCRCSCHLYPEPTPTCPGTTGLPKSLLSCLYLLLWIHLSEFAWMSGLMTGIQLDLGSHRVPRSHGVPHSSPLLAWVGVPPGCPWSRRPSEPWEVSEIHDIRGVGV